MPKLPEQTSGVALTHKKPAARSVAYPAFTVTQSKEFTQNIYSHFGGNSFNTRETIAKILKKNAEYLKSPISASVQYGLLEMRSKVGYKITPRFMDLYKQDDQEIYRNTMIACLKSPALYVTLLEAYKGDIVPSVTVLANSLFKKYGIVENVSERVASVFLQNLDDLGLIATDRKLLDIDKSQLAEVIEESTGEDELPMGERKDNSEPEKQSTPILPADPLSFIIEVPLIDNRKAKILCPMDVKSRDLKKIIKVLNSYIDDEDAG